MDETKTRSGPKSERLRAAAGLSTVADDISETEVLDKFIRSLDPVPHDLQVPTHSTLRRPRCSVRAVVLNGRICLLLNRPSFKVFDN
jgi:hypothetical protein